ncbi:MAG TPA: hypothetical protein VLX28_27560 [Thermoanaerobaculia bacterium]|nr:hypothetical protein [Thermoanaerobaculia bacterium]
MDVTASRIGRAAPRSWKRMPVAADHPEEEVLLAQEVLQHRPLSHLGAQGRRAEGAERGRLLAAGSQDVQQVAGLGVLHDLQGPLAPALPGLAPVELAEGVHRGGVDRPFVAEVAGPPGPGEPRAHPFDLLQGVLEVIEAAAQIAAGAGDAAQPRARRPLSLG